MKEQRVFITGGAGGLGKAIAEFYAREGHKVCIGDVNEDLGAETQTILRELQEDALFIPCDVANLEDFENVRDTLVERWGGVDILVNNAGVAGSIGFLEEVAVTDWEWVVNINLLGPVRGSKAFMPLFMTQGFGHIVNIASAAGLLNGPRMSNYSATKAAVVSLSESQRIELSRFENINVSVVCPGFFPTNLAQTIRSGDDATVAWVEKVMERTGITARDVAQLIYNAVNTQQFWVLPHPLERRLWLLKRYLPNLYFKQMVKKTRKMFTAKSSESSHA